MVKEKLTIVGSVIEKDEDNSKYVVYYTDESNAYTIKKDCTAIEIVTVKLNDLLEGAYKITAAEEIPIVDESSFTEKQREEFRKRVDFLEEVESVFGPNFSGIKNRENSSRVRGIIDAHKFSPKKGWQLIRRYLQSCLSLTAAVDMRTRRTEHKEYEYTSKTGQEAKRGTIVKGVIITDEVRNQFETYRQVYLKNKYKTYKEAYIDLLYRYYSRKDGQELVLLPLSERPTFDQFYNYCYTRNKQEEIDKKKMGAEDQRNNRRLLLGSVRTGVKRPAQILELDALDADIELVSELNETQSLGRAEVYAAVDVYTGAIVAITAGFNTNSNIGLSGLFLNIIEDKQELLRSVGIELDGEIPWPSDFIPASVRCDNGSDFTSNPFEEVCDRLGIKVEHVPPKMGSLKPLVEHSFHLFQQGIRSELAGIGLIEKDAISRRKVLCLTLRECRQLLYSFVIFHNARANINYPRTPDMIKRKIGTSPIALWEYGILTAGSPRLIRTPAQKQQFIYDLMIKDKASMSRFGIKFEGLWYTSDDEDMLEKFYDAGDKRKTLEIRYDPRTVDEIYTDDRGVLKAFPLNPEKNNNIDFSGMTWSTYLAYRKENLEIRACEKEKNLEIDIAKYEITKSIVQAAKKSRGGNKILTTDIKEARNAAKQTDNYNNRFAAVSGFGSVPQQELPDSEPAESVEKDDFTPYDNDDEMFD